ncbi:MAG: hypothetical protein FWF02_05430 [Micrococcales bacterium]|nr:hypothetical protein [Micrococcales bacterium]MCL2667134.1 hypothetical protein [Micrococcales bacterium]
MRYRSSAVFAQRRHVGAGSVLASTFLGARLPGGATVLVVVVPAGRDWTR